MGEAATAWLRGLGGRGAEQIGGAAWVGRSLRAMALGVVNEELVALLLQQHHASSEGGGEAVWRAARGGKPINRTEAVEVLFTVCSKL